MKGEPGSISGSAMDQGIAGTWFAGISDFVGAASELAGGHATEAPAQGTSMPDPCTDYAERRMSEGMGNCVVLQREP